MNDKLVVSEKALRQFLAMLDAQTKKDKDSIVQLWQQVVRDKKQMPCTCWAQGIVLAEREGFEPSVGDSYTRFRDEPIQPLWHLSRQTFIVLESDAKINGDFMQKRR